jgi:hypothetical protein
MKLPLSPRDFCWRREPTVKTLLNEFGGHFETEIHSETPVERPVFLF